MSKDLIWLLVVLGNFSIDILDSFLITYMQLQLQRSTVRTHIINTALKLTFPGSNTYMCILPEMTINTEREGKRVITSSYWAAWPSPPPPAPHTYAVMHNATYM